MRVLVAFEDVRYVYAGTIARAIRELRPGLRVRSTVLEDLDRELGGFDPNVVVCSRPDGEHPSARARGSTFPPKTERKTTSGWPR